MSIESLKNSELTSNQIDAVTGGDHGDTLMYESSETEDGVTPLYSVGQYVEVYDNLFRITTERSEIISMRITHDRNRCGDFLGPLWYFPLYTVRILKTGEIREVKADEIESK